MLQPGNIKKYFLDHRLLYLSVIFILFAGFFTGGIWIRNITEAEFLESITASEDFIQSAKQQETNYLLMLSEGVRPYWLLLAASLFLAGLPFVVFFLFQAGFSSGFFLTFLVKAFGMKGLLLSCIFLFLEIVFFLPALALLGGQCLLMSRYIAASATHHATGTKSFKSVAAALVCTFGLCILWAAAGISIKYCLLPPVCRYLFV